MISFLWKIEFLLMPQMKAAAAQYGNEDDFIIMHGYIMYIRLKCYLEAIE